MDHDELMFQLHFPWMFWKYPQISSNATVGWYSSFISGFWRTLPVTFLPLFCQSAYPYPTYNTCHSFVLSVLRHQHGLPIGSGFCLWLLLHLQHDLAHGWCSIHIHRRVMGWILKGRVRRPERLSHQRDSHVESFSYFQLQRKQQKQPLSGLGQGSSYHPGRGFVWLAHLYVSVFVFNVGTRAENLWISSQTNIQPFICWLFYELRGTWGTEFGGINTQFHLLWYFPHVIPIIIVVNSKKWLNIFKAVKKSKN